MIRKYLLATGSVTIDPVLNDLLHAFACRHVGDMQIDVGMLLQNAIS